MMSKKKYLRRQLMRKVFWGAFIFVVAFLVGCIIGKYGLGENKKEKIMNPQITIKNIEKVTFEVPYIVDPKAVLKAQYLDLKDYPSYILARCLEDNLKGKWCKDKNILITAYLYKNANSSFCENLNNPIEINDKKYEINNLDDVKKVCKIFYLIKHHKLEKKDCISPVVSTLCAAYFGFEKVDFIKSNLQYLSLLKHSVNEEKITASYCLKLEEPTASYCLRKFKLNCYNLESKEEIEKCMELLARPDYNYRLMLNQVDLYLKNNEWNKIKKLVSKYSDNPKYLHSLARLGALNGSICSEIGKYSKKDERYCEKRFFNQRIMCDYSPDVRQCYFFDVILNNKSCEQLKDPILKTDCMIFKKYYGKRDCSFFQEVGSDEYNGYLCALKSKKCEGDYYYDKMYELLCRYWVGRKKEKK